MLHLCTEKKDAVAEYFADNSMFFSVGKTALVAVTKLNVALEDVAKWVEEADSVLNKEKCLAMIAYS